jgi:hypothetical protein
MNATNSSEICEVVEPGSPPRWALVLLLVPLVGWALLVSWVLASARTEVARRRVAVSEPALRWLRVARVVRRAGLVAGVVVSVVGAVARMAGVPWAPWVLTSALVGSTLVWSCGRLAEAAVARRGEELSATVVTTRAR